MIIKNENDKKGSKSSSIIYFFITLQFLLFIISLAMAYQKYQNLRITEPYAEIISLFPLFYILLAINAVLTVWFIWHFEMNTRLQLTCLFFSCIVLWYTPYLMSGFVKQCDTLWHSGMANHAVEILNDHHMPFDGYVTNFPISYVWGFSFISTISVELVALSNYIFPFIFSVILSFLIYLIFSEFYTRKIASLALIISVPLLHYISLHFSPQVIGTIFLLTAILCILRNKISLSLFFGLLVLPLTHLLSFSLFIIFLGLFFTTKKRNTLSDKIKYLFNNKVLLLSICVLTLFLIYFLFLFTSLPTYVKLAIEKISVLDAKLFINENVLQLPWFKLLGLIIYTIVFFSFLFTILILYKNKIKMQARKTLIPTGTSHKTMVIVIFSLVSLLFGISLALIQRSAVLIERGLSFFLLFSILFIVAKSIRYDFKSKKQYRILGVTVVSLFLLYPLCSYSIDSYNSYPVSDKHGLIFLTSDVNLSNQTIEILDSPGQIDAFISPAINLSFISSSNNYDIIVFRTSLKYNILLNDPDTIELFHPLETAFLNESKYNRIYFNPTFFIYKINDNYGGGGH